MPRPDKDLWNQNIRKNIRTQRSGAPTTGIRAESENTYNRFDGPPKLGSGNAERKNLQSLLGHTARDVQYAEAMKLIKL